jgi:predicted nucleic acid-binding protein
LSDLPIQIEPPRPVVAWSALLAFAVQHRLTVYDAAYLELAARFDLPLATLDRDMQNAARSLNILLEQETA